MAKNPTWSAVLNGGLFIAQKVKNSMTKRKGDFINREELLEEMAERLAVVIAGEEALVGAISKEVIKAVCEFEVEAYRRAMNS